MGVTVCIPTYNQENYVEATVRSAAEQRPLPDAIIVSNDASTDGTAAILDRLEREIGILRVIHQPVNLGIGGNVEAVLKMATTEYVVKLDSDDLLLPGFIAELGNALDTFPAAGYAHGQIQEINDLGQPTNLRKLYRTPGYESPEEALRKSVLGYRVAANILMYRREALERVGFVRSDMAFAEDFFLNVAILDAGFGNVYVNKTLAKYRVWSDEGDKRRRRKLVELEGLHRVFREGIIPAFKRRGWPLTAVEHELARFAVTHADSLSWPLFSDAEKQDIEAALLKLSEAPSVRRAIRFYRNGFGWIYQVKNGLARTAKSAVKRVALR